MRRLIVIGVFALSLLWLMPTTAQEDACNIDLSDIAVLLIQAQDAAGAGDNTTALSLLADAEAKITTLRTECGGALGAFNTYVTNNGELRFNYPSSYLFFEENRSTFIVVTSEAARELFFEVGPDFPAGEQAIGVLIGDARQVGGARGDDLQTIIGTYAAQLTEAGYTTGDQVDLDDVSNPTIQLNFSGDTFESTLIGVELDASTFAVVIGTGASGEFDALEPIMLDIAASVEPAPIPEPEPVELAESYNLRGILSFSYPEGWIVSNEDFGTGESALLASRASTLALLESSDSPILQPEDIILGVIYGDVEDITSSRADFSDSPSLEEIAEELDILGDSFGVVSEFVTYGDLRVLELRFGIQGTPLSALMNLVELRRGEEYAIVLMVIAPNTVEENTELMRAVTESIRFPPSGEPIGSRNTP